MQGRGGAAVVAAVLGALALRPSPTPAQTAVAFISDGHLSPTEAGALLMSGDLNQVDDQIPAGWTLACVVTTGDITDISTASDWDFDRVYADSDLSALPILFAVGNHETSDNAFDVPTLRAKYAGYPAWNLRAGPATCPGTTYSFDAGDLHVVVLNVYCDGVCDTCASGDVGDELFEWLKDDLRGTVQPCTVVCAHEPAYPEDRHVGDSLDQYPAHRDRFWDLLRTEGVAAYVNGHTHYRKAAEHVGVYDVTGGPFGAGCWGTLPATFTYAACVAGELEIRQVSRPGGAPDWADAESRAFAASDLEWRVLVNTGEGAGTPSRFFVDYTALDQSPDPDWSENNGGRWWEPAFDDAAAGWSDGEPAVGYDAAAAWPWMNTAVDPLSGVHGVFERIPFAAPAPGAYALLRLEADYDDALVVWLNGTRIFASDNAPVVEEGALWNLQAAEVHNASGEHAHAPSLAAVDVTAHKAALLEGGNLLAVGCWNASTDSHDLAAGVRLSLASHAVELPARLNFGAAAPYCGFTPAGAEEFGVSQPYGWR